MKKFLLSSLCALLAAVSMSAQNYQAIPDTVYARNACLERDNWLENTDRPEYDKQGRLKKTPGESDSSTKNTWRYYLTWPSGNTTVAYYVHVPEGHFKADMVISTKTGKTATVKTKFIDPETQQVLYSADLQLNQPGAKQTVECVPDMVITRDAWYRLEFYCENGSSLLDRFDYVLCYHESKTAVCTPRIYSAIATYLNSWKSTNAEAPSGASYDFVYLEVQAPEGQEHINSYISTMNLLGGYLGIQSCLNQNSRNYFGDYWRNVIFSMWDNGDVDKTPYLPDYLRSGGFDKNEHVVFNRFGNEGTGIQAMKGEASWWEPGKWVQMLFTCRPEDITVTIEDDNGQEQTFTYNNTLVTLWYKMEDQDEWIYQATLRKSGLGNYVDTWGSFLENWVPTAGQFQRTAVFRNCYLHSIASNKWYHCNRASSGVYYDPSRLRSDLRDRRIDMNWGVWDEDPSAIYMTAGGYVNMHDCVMRTYDVPLSQDQACVDTIDTHRLLKRVDQAVKNYYTNTVMEERISASGNVTGLKALMKQLLDEADHFNGYRSEDLAGLQDLYENGSGTFAIQKMQLRNITSNKMPLIYSTVQRMENIGTYRAYVLHHPQGMGDVIAAEIDGVRTLAAANSTTLRATEQAKQFLPVTDNAGNWVIIRPDKGSTYYLYNIGLGKFLNLDNASFLSNQAVPVEIAYSNGNGFSFKQNGNYLSITPTSATATITKSRTLNSSCYFDLRDNITMQPTDDFINGIIEKTLQAGDFNALIEEVNAVLELPEGVVGSIADPETLAILKDAVNGGDITYEELAELLHNAARVPFEPATTLYRIRSSARTYMARPYITLGDNTDLTLAPLNPQNAGQIWQFRQEGEGYRLTTQAVGVQPLPNLTGQTVVVEEDPGVTYLVDLGGSHFALCGSQSNTFGIYASNSTLKTGSISTANGQWFLEPATTFQVSFDANGLASFCADFDMALTADIKAFTATNVSVDGEVTIEPVDGANIPASTPVLLASTPETSGLLTVGIVEAATAPADATPSTAPKATANGLLKGTYQTAAVEANTAYLLQPDKAEKPQFALSAATTVPANTAYLAVGDVPAALQTLTIGNLPDGIRAIHGSASSQGKAYDLQGRRTEHPNKGIVIQDGKKVVQ